MLLARQNVDNPRAAVVVASEHNARWASGCQPPSVEKVTSEEDKPDERRAGGRGPGN